jgi:hypothetical protein
MASRSSPRIRLVGGPRVLDGTLWPEATGAADAEPRLLMAVRAGHACALVELIGQCVDRRSAEHLAGGWRVAAYSVSGRRRRIRPRLYRYEATFTLEADRCDDGSWSLRPSRRWVAATTVDPPPDPRDAAPSLAGASEASVWSRLEAGVDLSAARFRVVAELVPQGPLSERALSVVAAVDECVVDAARLCAVGATAAPDWQPGQADDEGAALVARVTALVGTIDEATRELVHLHLELGETVRPAETLALLSQAMAELSASVEPPD